MRPTESEVYLGEIAHAEKALEHALKRTHATIKKRDNRGRNRTFKAWTVAALLERYQDPRAILLEIASTPTNKLAEQMNASLADALAERRLCAQAVLPYLAQKLPVQVYLRQTRAIVLNIVDDAQYQELVTLDAQADDANNDDGSFSMQLVSASPAQETTQQTDQTPQPQHQGTAQTQEQRGGTPVTPSVAADHPQGPAGGYLRPIGEFFDGPSRARRQHIDDVPAAAPTHDQWERTDHGVWAPERRK